MKATLSWAAGLIAGAGWMLCAQPAHATTYDLRLLSGKSSNWHHPNTRKPDSYLTGFVSGHKVPVCIARSGEVGFTKFQQSGGTWKAICTATTAPFFVPSVSVLSSSPGFRWKEYSTPPKNMPPRAVAILNYVQRHAGAPCLGHMLGNQWTPGWVPKNGLLQCHAKMWGQVVKFPRFKLLEHKAALPSNNMWIKMKASSSRTREALPINAIDGRGKFLCRTRGSGGYLVGEIITKTGSASGNYCRALDKTGTNSWAVREKKGFDVYVNNSPSYPSHWRTWVQRGSSHSSPGKNAFGATHKTCLVKESTGGLAPKYFVGVIDTDKRCRYDVGKKKSVYEVLIK